MATRTETVTDIDHEIRRIGRVFNQDVMSTTLALFAPLQERAPKDGVEATRDLAYGEHDRHRLDVFAPARRPDTLSPVVVYIHGGAFIGGSRDPAPGLIYDNVPTFFARHGLIGVNATYRLAPEFKWPSGATDVGAIVGWLKENVIDYGGDPDLIFLMGQSAGATHVATYTFIEAVHGPAGSRVAGAILLSGSYAPLDPNFSEGKPGANQIAYYGEDTSRWAEMSPLYHVEPGHPPVFLCVTEYDPYPLAWPTTALLGALIKCDKLLPSFKLLRGHNHVSPAMHINSEVDRLGLDLLAFVTGDGDGRGRDDE